MTGIGLIGLTSGSATILKRALAAIRTKHPNSILCIDSQQSDFIYQIHEIGSNRFVLRLIGVRNHGAE